MNNPDFGSKQRLLLNNINFERNLNKLYNARMLIEPWAFLTHDNKLIFNESSCYGNEIRKHLIFKKFYFGKPLMLRGKTLFLSCRINYWHLIVNELTDIQLLLNNNLNINEYDHLIFESHESNAGRELQNLFKLKREKSVSLVKNRYIEFEELHFLYGSHDINYESLIDVKEKILKKINQNNQYNNFSSKHVIVSRKDSKRRKWLNENDCIDSLKQFDFKVFILSELSLLEQYIIFSNAEIIVGVHGAGLTNIIFCNKKTNLIELRSDKQSGVYSSAQCYENLSNILEIRHHYFPCHTIERKEYKGRSIEDADIEPNVLNLKLYIKELLNESQKNNN